MSAAAYPSTMLWSSAMPDDISTVLARAIDTLNHHKSLKKDKITIETREIAPEAITTVAEALQEQVLVLTAEQAMMSFDNDKSDANQLNFKLPVGCIVLMNAMQSPTEKDIYDTAQTQSDSEPEAEQQPRTGASVLDWIHANAADVILLDMDALQSQLEHNSSATESIVMKLRDDLMVALPRAKRQSKVVRLGEYLLKENSKLQGKVDSLIQDQQDGQLLQMKLLPASPKALNVLSFEHYLSPALTLSGDFIDYFNIDENTIGFYLADVVGHGVSAAMVTVLLKTNMSRYLTRAKLGKNDTIRDPAALMYKLNDSVLDTHLDKHLTLVYGVIDTTSNTLQYVNAGHFPYPALWNGDTWEPLHHADKPVGLFESAVFTTQTVQLPEAFRLFISSDGYLESLAGESNDDKTTLLLEHVATAQRQEDDSLLSGIIKASGLEDAERIDDISMLLIEKPNQLSE